MMYPKYPRRSYKSYGASDGKVALDYSKDNQTLLREILSAVVAGNAVSGGKKGKLLGNLLAFVKYRNHNAENPNRPAPALSVAEQLMCFRAALVHDSWEVRAAALRCIRYLIRTREDAEACVACHIPILVARSLDLMLENHSERIYALGLMRSMAFLAPDIFPDTMVRSLVAVIQDAPSLNDWMFKAALAVACELGLQNPILLVECGGVGALSHSLSFCPNSAPAIAESVLGVLLYLLNALETRKLLALAPDDLTLAVEEHWTLKDILARSVESSVDRRDPLSVLHATMAPLTDTVYRPSESGTDAASGSDDRDPQGQASIQVLLSSLRSWSGMVSFFTNPTVEFTAGSLYSSQPPLQSIVSVLGAKNANTKVQILNAIMVCLFELFQVPVPEWTADFLQALRSTDPSAAQDSWKLYEGFVAAEGNALIPMPGVARLRLAKNHAALLLSTFLAIGLLEALVNVVLEGKAHLSIRAVILLGELLHLSEVLLPAGVCVPEKQSCLKRLVAAGTDTKIPAEERERALQSLSALARIHDLKKRPPKPYSPFLEQLMIFAKEAGKKASGSNKENKKPTVEKSSKSSPAASQPNARKTSVAKRDKEETLAAIVDETLVLTTDDFAQWNWNAISAVFSSPHASFKRYWEDPSSKSMLTRLMTFFKPGSMQFSAMETSSPFARICTIVCCSLVTFLAEAVENDANRLLEEFGSDIRAELGILAGEKASTNRVTAFTPSRVHNTMAHAYFLFVGRLTRNPRGLRLLNKLGMIPLLYTLTSQPSHDSHQKLVLSSLDYSVATPCRSILEKSLKQSTDAGRLYATQLLEVLARLETPDFHLWGTRLLAAQLFDPASTISMTASRILDKVCDNERCLESLIDLKPGVLHFGERGLLLYIRFLSVPKGFYHLRDNGFLNSELEKWRDHWNLRYVKILESVLHDSLSYYQRGEDGTYGRRTNDQHHVGQCRLVTHLYGEIVKHQEGFDFFMNKEKATVDHVCEMIVSAAQETRKLDLSHAPLTETLGYDNAGDLLELKAAVWAVAHICSSDLGVRHMIETYFEVIPAMAHMASFSPVFSLRGTCFYALGLVASTPPGVSFLAQIGWESVTVRSSDGWPTRNWEEASTEPVIDYSLEMDDGLEFPASNGFEGLTAAIVRRKSDTDASRRVRSVSMDDAMGNSKSRADTGIVLHDDGSGMEDEQRSFSSPPIGFPGSTSSPIMLLVPGSANGGDEASLDQSGLSTDSGIVQEIEAIPDRRKNVAPLVYLTPPSESMDNRYGLTEDNVMYYPGTTRRKPRVHRNTTCSADLPSRDFKIDTYLRQRSVTSECAATEMLDGDPTEMSSFARRRPRFVPIAKSPGPSEQSSIFRSLRYYRRPEHTNPPFEVPLNDAPALTTPTSVLMKGPLILRDMFEHHHHDKRHSISVASYLSNSAPTKRPGKLWTHFSMRRSRRSESDAAARKLTAVTKGLANADQNHASHDNDRDTNVSPGPGRRSLTTWLANKTPLFRRTRRQNSIGNASFSSQDSGDVLKTAGNAAFADIPEVPSQPDLLRDRDGVDEPDARKVAEALIEADVSEKGEAEEGKSKKEQNGPQVRYVGVALPRNFTALLSAGEPTSKSSGIATSVDGTNEHGGLPDIPETVSMVNHGERPSDDFPGLQFLDTGDHRARPKAAGLAFHLSGSSLGSKSIDGGDRFIAGDASRAMSERDLGEASGFRHDESRCLVCHKTPALLTKYPDMPLHRSRFETSNIPPDGKPTKDAVVRREVLRLVTNMCSSVGLRGAERELLLLKQKYSSILRDPCLYSEVSKLMSQCPFRLQSRRFLQELFLDADFSYVITIPQFILGENA